MTYEIWRAHANVFCVQLAGLGLDDMDDMPLARWYESGITPLTAAKRAIKWTRRGYRPDFAD